MENAPTTMEGSDKVDVGVVWTVEDMGEIPNGAPQAPPVAAPHRNSLLASLLADVAPQAPRKASVFDVLEASASIVNVDNQYDSTDNLVAAEQRRRCCACTWRT